MTRIGVIELGIVCVVALVLLAVIVGMLWWFGAKNRQDEAKICQHCGSPNPLGNQYCGNCGEPLDT